MVAETFSGQYRSVFKGRGMNFEEVRQYQPGDEVRSIDWNVTAKFGEVHGDAFVKKFTEERELTVMLVVDVSASGDFGSVELSKRELEAEVACMFAFSAIRNNDKVGLIPFSWRKSESSKATARSGVTRFAKSSAWPRSVPRRWGSKNRISRTTRRTWRRPFCGGM